MAGHLPLRACMWPPVKRRRNNLHTTGRDNLHTPCKCHNLHTHALHMSQQPAVVTTAQQQHLPPNKAAGSSGCQHHKRPAISLSRKSKVRRHRSHAQHTTGAHHSQEVILHRGGTRYKGSRIYHSPLQNAYWWGNTAICMQGALYMMVCSCMHAA